MIAIAARPRPPRRRAPPNNKTTIQTAAEDFLSGGGRRGDSRSVLTGGTETTGLGWMRCCGAGSLTAETTGTSSSGATSGRRKTSRQARQRMVLPTNSLENSNCVAQPGQRMRMAMGDPSRECDYSSYTTQIDEQEER